MHNATTPWCRFTFRAKALQGALVLGSAALVDSEKPECYRRANLRGSLQNPDFHRDLQTVLNNQVLVLNRLWQAVNICSARPAFPAVSAGHAPLVWSDGAHNLRTHD